MVPAGESRMQHLPKIWMHCHMGLMNWPLRASLLNESRTEQCNTTWKKQRLKCIQLNGFVYDNIMLHYAGFYNSFVLFILYWFISFVAFSGAGFQTCQHISIKILPFLGVIKILLFKNSVLTMLSKPLVEYLSCFVHNWVIKSCTTLKNFLKNLFTAS